MKELPYFKFNVAEWLQGDITLCDLETQGLFINICSYYWSKQGNVTYSNIKLRLSHIKATLFENLSHANIIKINDKKDTLNITFLDEQINERVTNHKFLSDSGKKGVEAKRIKKQTLTQQAPLKPPLSSALAPLKHIDKEEEKNKNKIILREQNFKNEVLAFNEKYPTELLKEFFNYWSEKNKSGTKMKWELKETFEISKRLTTWNKNNFNNKNFNNGKQIDKREDRWNTLVALGESVKGMQI